VSGGVNFIQNAAIVPFGSFVRRIFMSFESRLRRALRRNRRAVRVVFYPGNERRFGTILRGSLFLQWNNGAEKILGTISHCSYTFCSCALSWKEPGFQVLRVKSLRTPLKLNAFQRSAFPVEMDQTVHICWTPVGEQANSLERLETRDD